MSTITPKLLCPGYRLRRRDDLGAFVTEKGPKHICNASWQERRSPTEAYRVALRASWQNRQEELGLAIPPAILRQIDDLEEDLLKV